MNTKFILDFLKELSCNNNVDWMHANKPRCDNMREEFTVIVQEFINHLCLIDPSVKGLTPKDCMYRQARDIRFSQDKTPYKDHIGAFVAPGGHKSIKSGYYMHIRPNGESLICGGVYCLPPDALKTVRNEIQADGDRFVKIINTHSFKQNFVIESDSLKTMPRDFTAGSKYDKYIKMKNFMAIHYYTDEEVTDFDTFFKDVIEKCKQLKPLNQFFNDALYEY